MFEPLDEDESGKSSGSRRGMRVIWIVVVVSIVVLVVFAFV